MTKPIMTKKQRDELVVECKKLSKIKIAYLRELFMQNFPFIALGHTLYDIVFAIDCCIERECDIIKELLINITDHSIWTIKESVFIEEEKTRLYDEWITWKSINFIPFLLASFSTKVGELNV